LICNYFLTIQYGGGKVIRPGDELETKEDKEAKQKRTREVVAAYRKKMGLDVDPKLIAECKKVFLRNCKNSR
jgi:allophanate hydrolase subunit 2